MRVVGLTGSIGMGKSTVARMFAAHGAAVHDADRAVHDLYAAEAVAPIAAAFPGVVVDGVVDRRRLSAEVVGRPDRLAALEAIVHPLVRRREEAFLAEAQAAGAPFAVLDVPLLFETGGEARCDAVVVVNAPFAVQKARVLAREGMTEDRFAAILARQMPDAEKRRRADHVIDTGGPLEETARQVAALAARFAEGV
jgi:dephospho-CoA kinase